MNKPINNNGFSLIEVLVALVVLGVGILGVAGLQGSSLRNTYSTNLRTQASIIARDMAERIRANRDYALASAANYHIDLDSTAADDTDCTSTACSEAQLAGFDRSQWLRAISTLPGGNGSVSIDTGDGTATIVVMWDNDRSGATGTDCSNDHTQDLTCFLLTVNP